MLAEKRNKLKRDILTVVRKAIDAVSPDSAINRHCALEGNWLHIDGHRLDLREFKSVYVIGAGKASGLMASALEKMLQSRLIEGIVAVRDRCEVTLEKVELIEAGHPLPDRNSLLAAEETIRLAKGMGKDDLAICLISGGASALWSLPWGKITLDDMIETTSALLGCGATIDEINTVRKHLSKIKGGRLAQAVFPARLVTLAISDVVGNKPSSIGSGPTVPDPTTFKQAVSVIEKYGLQSRLPPAVTEHLRAGLRREVGESPKPEDAVFEGNIYCLVATNQEALRAAAQAGRALGYETAIISSDLAGEARDVGKGLGELVKKAVREGKPVSVPGMLFSGGETTVTVRGKGKGGRNQELVLSAAIEIAGVEGVAMASVGTDGIDGQTDAAGAFADGQTIQRGKMSGLDANKHLDDNNSYGYFEEIGELIRIGPTGTNVMDIQVLVIGG